MSLLKKDRGFSLIEAVLSIALIGVGLVGIVYSFQGAARSSLLADQTVIATNLARETLEKIIAYKNTNGYSNTLTTINTNNNYDENPVSGFSNYVIDATALEVDSDDDDNVDDFLDAFPGSGYARVTVNISWDNGNHSINLATLITDY